VMDEEPGLPGKASKSKSKSKRSGLPLLALTPTLTLTRERSEVARVHVIDSHTGGEPTRVVISGGPDLGGGSVAERLQIFREQHDPFRSAVVNEPRGSDVIVGALLLEPADPSCAAGVIFFNNVGTLGMCGHGTIGLVVTLSHMGRIGPGEHRIETPVGVVTTRLHESGVVSVGNVSSYRLAKGVSVPVEGHGTVTGDVAWGGNWFFLVEEHGQELSLGNVAALTDFTWRVRQALARHGITGRDGQEIDHIELFGPSDQPEVHSRNFVLCPGKAYDRSPCGTGTSAKLACLYADGKLQEGEVWRQESLVGSVFEGSIQVVNGELVPIIKGNAFVTAEATLILDPADPFCWGIRERDAIITAGRGDVHVDG
jgi:4-hydroxyproline epimerase